MKRITFSYTVAILAIICFFIITLTEDCEQCFSAPVMAVKFFICGLIISIGGIYFTREFLRTEKIVFEIESLPLLETDEAADGVPFVGRGIVEPEDDKVLKSPYTNTPCVYFHSIKEEYVGYFRKNAYWKIVENIALFVPFYIRDERGKLKVDLTNLDNDFSGYKIPIRNVPSPQNSEIDCDILLKHQPYHLFLKNKKGIFFFPLRSKYRISEFVLKPGTKVFVTGMVSRRNGQLVLHEDEKFPLIISKKNRDQYVQEFYRGGNLIYLSYLLVSVGFTTSLLAINYFIQANPAILLTFLFMGNTIILGSALFSVYNRIITLKNRALNSLSNIDVELKRKIDLIANIVEVLKGYVKHESETQRIVAEGRVKIMFSDKLKKEEKPIIPSLVAAIENYPNIKASENFQSLIKTLVDIEERIAYSREFYNRSVRKYNILIKQIPFLFVASILGLKKMDFITIGKEIENHSGIKSEDENK